MHGRGLIKAATMSLLVAVGIVAVSASAAQANWVLKKNKSSVSQLKLKGNVLLTELLIPELEIAIHCTGGNMLATLTSGGGGTTLSGTASATLTGCKLLEFEKICTVESLGAGAGKINYSFSGNLKMEGEKTFALVSNGEFTKISITGALCPFALEGSLTMAFGGSMTMNIVNPLTEQVNHLIEINDEELFYGEEEVVLDGELLEPGVHADSTVVHMEEEIGSTWAVQLAGL